MSRAELESALEEMRKMVAHVFTGRDMMHPMMLGFFPGGVIPITFQMPERMSEKRMLNAAMRAQFKEAGVTHFVLAMEVWTAVEEAKVRGMPDLKELGDRPGFKMPSERADRTESIFYIAQDREGLTLIGKQDIKRKRPEARGKLAAYEDISMWNFQVAWLDIFEQPKRAN